MECDLLFVRAANEAIVSPVLANWQNTSMKMAEDSFHASQESEHLLLKAKKCFQRVRHGRSHVEF